MSRVRTLDDMSGVKKNRYFLIFKIRYLKKTFFCLSLVFFIRDTSTKYVLTVLCLLACIYFCIEPVLSTTSRKHISVPFLQIRGHPFL